ncbi:hypothetical protein DVH05_001231 [Phytophthora capsici]|nr:hypothetical protein DVH05_001231 [Phytophthora capsici]
MDLRTRAAQKRPLTHSAEWESDESESNSSDAPPDDVWAPSPVVSDLDTTHIPLEPVSCSDPPESTSSTSEGGSSVRVLALAPTKVGFPSWEVFEDYLAIFRVRTNTTVAERNARIDRTKSKAKNLPGEWVQYAKTFVCTYSGKFKSQATSKRPRQESRMKGYNAQVK